MVDMQELLDQLRLPFHPSMVEWKPGAIKGERALAMPYADLRAYMNRLDEVCGTDWSVAYEPWGEDRIICQLTICGVTRSSTGETTNESEKNEIGGTVAEAQAMKRACAMFGLGRYLYTLPSGWVDYDAKSRQFTAQAKAKLTGILTQHYRRAMEGRSVSEKVLAGGTIDDEETDDDPDSQGTPPNQRLWGQGASAFGTDWKNGARPWLIKNWTEKIQKSEPRDSMSQLSDDEKDLLADYIKEHLRGLQKGWQQYKKEMAQAA